ncbi:MarR family winged helix-turn-helix transcriptional regulator [Ruania alba]|uniref:DNA-binding transcriptional regulator, MarR family n=1 Tax=Ruania alba TaxID=648782 RepID=A0A1H5CKK7_9MICO|nr:MarR family winged helix-turn-helix transcriptional regulator [Ruania alba]SED67213.1 DNA-binding transcriptional regulator, MarR family [Ruania alba]
MPQSAPLPDEPTPAPGPGVAERPDEWPTGRLLSAAARRVERAWDTYLAQWSLSHASLPVLAVLAGGGHSQREIAEHTGVTEQTMSRIILGLERTGYVRRYPHPEDRRRHIVEITGEGFAALSSLNVPDAIDGLVTHDLDETELADLRRLLIRFLG